MQVASTPSTSTPADVEIVKSFLDALERYDIDGALSLCAPTMRWQNAPLPATRHKKQFEQQVRWMWKRMETFRVVMKEIKGYDGSVFTDRIDIIDGHGFHLELPVEGTFKVREGLITEWVDRFDYLPIGAALVKSLPAMIRSLLGGRRGS